MTAHKWLRIKQVSERIRTSAHLRSTEFRCKKENWKIIWSICKLRVTRLSPLNKPSIVRVYISTSFPKRPFCYSGKFSPMIEVFDSNRIHLLATNVKVFEQIFCPWWMWPWRFPKPVWFVRWTSMWAVLCASRNMLESISVSSNEPMMSLFSICLLFSKIKEARLWCFVLVLF